MKLDYIKLKNFRGYKDEISISFDNITAFIGKNDVGKSTVLEALEIFFNNDIVKIEKDDLNVNADDNEIEITCVFSDLPNKIIIDASNETTLEDEYLLNNDGKLEIKKVYKATVKTPKEIIKFVCNHPINEGINNLLELGKEDLAKKAMEYNVFDKVKDKRKKAELRKELRKSINELKFDLIDLEVDKEDTSRIYKQLESNLPLFALFQSDRKSQDDDKEVLDPMKFAVKRALDDKITELEIIKAHVRDEALKTADETLKKLKEMAPEIANELTSEFKTEPSFNDKFKLKINSDNNIAINKRGSGVRRLILLNFFRAEAERKIKEGEERNIIYAFEEPETSQHPDHQEMLINAFIDLSNLGSQIILTTHTPALAGLLPLHGIRFIRKEGDKIFIEQENEEVYKKIAKTLGVIPNPIDKSVKAAILLEGKDDYLFVNHFAEKLKEGKFIDYTFEDKNIMLIPTGGCDNLTFWVDLDWIKKNNLPYGIFRDSERGTNQEKKALEFIKSMKMIGIKAYATKKREIENYLHPKAINPHNPPNMSDTEDAKTKINALTKTSKRKIIETYLPNMTVELIREVEEYEKNGLKYYEFTDMFNDFLSLVK